MILLSTEAKDAVLHSVKKNISQFNQSILDANAIDLESWSGTDQAMYDRLIVNDQKITGMIRAVDDIISDSDPVGKELYHFHHENGMRISNRTAPFGTVLIIYESRPDVTIEAAMVAFKSNNKILLKGGKEAIHTNRVLVNCWHEALKEHGLDKDWITLLEFDRQRTREYLKSPDHKIDLIVPRGGDGLINFVKAHATCPVLVSGRGNNFLYVHYDADWEQAIPIIINAKTDKISACNALDKVLINEHLPELDERMNTLFAALARHGVEIVSNVASKVRLHSMNVHGDDLASEWPEEYLAMKIAIGLVEDTDEAIHMINTYSGGHSATILTGNRKEAKKFMEEVDAAAVYHNASTRFTDGGQFGLGAELAISTDKLHHRGPLGLHQLVTNKWYVFGDGQIR